MNSSPFTGSNAEQTRRHNRRVVFGGALPDSALKAQAERISLADHAIANRADRQIPRVMQGQSGWLSAAQSGAALVINRLFIPPSLS